MECDVESFNPLNTWLVPLASSPTLWESPRLGKLRYDRKGLVMNNNRCSSLLYHLGNYKGCRSSVPGTRNKDQMYSSYYITVSQIISKVSSLWGRSHNACLSWGFEWEKTGVQKRGTGLLYMRTWRPHFCLQLRQWKIQWNCLTTWGWGTLLTLSQSLLGWNVNVLIDSDIIFRQVCCPWSWPVKVAFPTSSNIITNDCWSVTSHWRFWW